jgi:hypothetical protein
LKSAKRSIFLSFLLIRGYSDWFVSKNRSAFDFVLMRHDAKSLANFKYELRPIINSEVNALAKAAKKKAKKVAKKK